MSDTDKHIKQIQEIKSIMEKSTRFVSLSGLSGVFAGIYALVGAYLAGKELNSYGYENSVRYYTDSSASNNLTSYFLIIAIIVLAASLITGYFLSYKKAKKSGEKMFTTIAFRMMFNLFLPLFVGGAFCISLIFKGVYGFVAPAMLVFYGMALLNASKYTLSDIRYLGFAEMILGLVATFFIGEGLLFWAIGFGVFHIIYGIVMYLIHDRKA
jgi:hypothetical protein